MNVHTSHLLPARCARPTDWSAPSSASSAPERVSDLRRTCFESSTLALVCSTSILYSLYWHRGGGKREAAVFGNGSTLFNWRQTDCSKHLRDFKTVYVFFPLLLFLLKCYQIFICKHSKVQTHMFVCAFVCFFLLYECESDTEFIWKLYPSICASLRACMRACVLVSECFKCYPVPAELFIISICVCMLVCLLCIHHRSHQSLTCFLFLFFYNQHVRCWRREALFSTFLNGTG